MHILHKYGLITCLVFSSMWCLLPPKKTVWSDESGKPVSERVIDTDRLLTRLAALWAMAGAIYLLTQSPANLLKEEDAEEFPP